MRIHTPKSSVSFYRGFRNKPEAAKSYREGNGPPYVAREVVSAMDARSPERLFQIKNKSTCASS